MLAASSVARASSGLTGTYTTTLKSPAELKGRWVLTFARGGSYTVRLNGQLVARGKYTSTAKTITLDREQGSRCTGAGTYAWKKSGKTMTFAKKREPRPARRVHWSSRTGSRRCASSTWRETR